jgi:large subunit ribosomal protein L10e
MTRKPAKMYREIRGQAYTHKEYIGGVPGSKVIHYDMGNLKEDFPFALSLVAEESCQIRHIALEAARITANKYLMNELGKQSYHLKLRVYPHNVLRENKQAVGAGADRVSQGMRNSFGKPVGTAARVKHGQEIFTVSGDQAQASSMKEALRRAKNKLPTPCRIVAT